MHAFTPAVADRRDPQWLMTTKDGTFSRPAPDGTAAVAAHNAAHPATPANAVWRLASTPTPEDAPF